MNVFQVSRPVRLTFFPLLLGLFFIPAQTWSQTNAVVISQEEAVSTAQQYEETFGFQNVYFTNDDINRILNQSGCTSIRFYTAANEMGGQTQIAVGVDANGYELGDYYRSDGMYSTVLDADGARAAVEASKASEQATVACTYANQDLTGMVMSESSSGIHIKPGIHEGSYSLVTVGASGYPDGSGTGDSGTTYLRGTAPCPTACGDGFLTDLGGE